MPTINPTWTLSGFGDEIDPDPKIQAAVMLALGAQYIEVRSAWGTNVVELDDAQVAELKSILDGAGLKVSAVASPIGKVDISLPATLEVERLRRIIEVAKALETKYIRMFSFFRAPEQTPEEIRDAVMERLALLAAEAEQAGVVLIHENEKDIYGDTPERVLDILQTVNSPALRAAWDNANFVQVGVKPHTDAYAMLRPYLEYLQVKDAIAGSGEVVPTGKGDGQLVETLTALRDDGYAGFASLEPHLAAQHELGGFSGPTAFGEAARAFRSATDAIGVTLA
ncbi:MULTISPECIES: sugar phosphate isomerase/epimerase [unclassified Arthrobacter]|uniref:sugar phosphate isomerase/epimerase family protein n=1 Tax=unclassified Arthrobacter TaxID=235627 RepID=UPI00159E494B|nr:MULTISPECIES: sugar phosphate isomerase/epimerase family protein [unclassified Arthrobacter]MCQ9162891.1 sugar phosphate isomerase/epimerase [Arthrobacter sp. STN4]NVM97427.1 sugar phosphate isomerase/epimerase [Arthrobacter sp. SDTb3-6]